MAPSLRREHGKLLVRLAKCTAMQVAGGYPTSDFIPPVGPIRARVAIGKKPSRVTLEPE